MTQADIWQLGNPYILQALELYGWGGFSGHHRAAIDAAGTAIIGPTGSGKTTLVDALMTLLAANPKYNLASTGGQDSDRDLVSYVRGVSGPGDGGEGQSHIARPGKTVTGIAATLHNGESLVRLGALLWFDGTSSSPSDMKKLWFFTTSPQQTLEHWLTLQHDGGMRALRQLDKTEAGIWTYPSKRAYLARIRDFFEVRENAFNLLNRAAGLKQLTSIDEIFRELVLDDTAQFDRAREVANSFDDLTAIHEELEISRRQIRSLEPIKSNWEKLEKSSAALAEKSTLAGLLPAWFGEQAYRLWSGEQERLTAESDKAKADLENAEERCKGLERTRDHLKEAYLKLGGSNIQMLEELIEEKRKNLSDCQGNAERYRQLAQKLELPAEIGRQAVAVNKTAAGAMLQQVEEELGAAEQGAYKRGGSENRSSEELKSLREELAEIERRPGSNIEARFQHFRAALAEELGLSEEALPFVAELVQVKDEEAAWRGAIERAIGGHRLRILVPPESAAAALHWVNSRHNALHIRILEVKAPDAQPRFREGGFTHKLRYKEHPYREAVKALLAGIDRQCVASPDELRHTPHGMTIQGLMSGKARFFDKQDQKRLDADWQTGFHNRDRLLFLKQKISEATERQRELRAQLKQAKAKVALIGQRKQLLERLQELDFEQIDMERAERELKEQQAKLRALTAPDSDVAAAKRELEDVESLLKEAREEWKRCIDKHGKTEEKQRQAETEKRKALVKSGAGLGDKQRELARKNFPVIAAEQIEEIADIEKELAERFQKEQEDLNEICSRLEKDLVKHMSDAQKEDRGALSDIGRELEDVPAYLERLRTLIEEALPEKRKRFKEYLNRSSDDGVTQLLMTIDSEVERIEEKLDEVNDTLRRVDFQAGRYLQLVSAKVIHESLRTFNAARTRLASSRFVEDEGESQYKALHHIIDLLRDACERHRTQSAKALLDPRFRLEFKVSVIDRATGHVIETRTGSQGGSGGEKEIIASYVLTGSLSYALCPDGSNQPLFGTIVLDEAFSRSSHAVAGRIIAALKEFGLHALFVTPNKEMQLLRKHTRSAIVVHRRGNQSHLATLSWQELSELHQQRLESAYETAG